MYGKLINETLEYAPNVYLAEYSIEVEKEDEEGNIITETITESIEIVNFDKNIELMKKYGFKEVIDIQPEYDVKTQEVLILGYSENENNIVVEYKIEKKPLTADEKLMEYMKTQDRLMISSRYSADTSEFKIENVLPVTTEKTGVVDYDLYNLLKRIIIVGKDNYNRDKMEEMLDFYVGYGNLDWDMWDELFILIELQHEMSIKVSEPQKKKKGRPKKTSAK